MLAEETGISRGHLGHYFKEKKDILFSLLDATIIYICKKSSAVCCEDSNPLTTYGLAVSWFCIVCAELKDMGKSMFQSIRHFDIQISFSQMFAKRLWECIGEGQPGISYDFFEKNVRMAFAAQFTGIAGYTIEEFGLKEAIESSEINTRVLLMLMGYGDDRTESIVESVQEHIEEVTVDKMIKQFTVGYNLFIKDLETSEI